jgi:hypothetical protein
MSDKPQPQFKVNEWVKLCGRDGELQSAIAVAVKSVEWDEKLSSYVYTLQGIGDERVPEDELEKSTTKHKAPDINPAADFGVNILPCPPTTTLKPKPLPGKLVKGRSRN